MYDQNDKPLTYNLWTEPWIDLERLDGSIDKIGIVETLLHAEQYRSLTFSSPLEAVAVHRFLAAILQDILQPSDMADLQRILTTGHFPKENLVQFGQQYAARFDLFSLEQPFLQSADLPLIPEKKTPSKTIAYLAYDLPSGTAIIHYNHRLEDDQAFCPVCCARGLICIPAFATSGGKGIKPSINGVPPIYILPCGKNLFESLALSLVLPDYQPAARDHNRDFAIWRHPPIIEKSKEINSVGYLHSLTFPARRVRLHPKVSNGFCTRCGNPSEILVPTMVFEMGEAYGKAAAWLDPFAAYTQEGNDPPKPVRPISGKATWREFGSLFLKHPPEPDQRNRHPIRPRLIDQLDTLEYATGSDWRSMVSFRTVGLRTDMKAKIFEWVDTGFDVPGSLLHNPEAALDIEDALDYAGDCERIMRRALQDSLNPKRKKGTKHLHYWLQLKDEYWNGLSRAFRDFALHLANAYQTGDVRQQRSMLLDWKEMVTRYASRTFEEAIQQIGDDGASLHVRYAAIENCNRLLFGSLKKETPNGQ